MKKVGEIWKEIAAVILIIGVAIAGSYLFLSCADVYAQRQAGSYQFVAAKFAGESVR